MVVISGLDFSASKKNSGYPEGQTQEEREGRGRTAEDFVPWLQHPHHVSSSLNFVFHSRVPKLTSTHAQASHPGGAGSVPAHAGRQLADEGGGGGTVRPPGCCPCSGPLSVRILRSCKLTAGARCAWGALLLLGHPPRAAQRSLHWRKRGAFYITCLKGLTSVLRLRGLTWTPRRDAGWGLFLRLPPSLSQSFLSRTLEKPRGKMAFNIQFKY